MCESMRTTHERPRDRFDRDERFLLSPARDAALHVADPRRPSIAVGAAPRGPRPVVAVEKRSLAAYAQLADGAV